MPRKRKSQIGRCARDAMRRKARREQEHRSRRLQQGQQRHVSARHEEMEEQHRSDSHRHRRDAGRRRVSHAGSRHIVDSIRGQGSSISVIPAWLESQGLPKASLRAVVRGLGIEILGALCARAEPAPARIRLCFLATLKFTSTMYAILCRFMESCHARTSSELTNVSRYENDSEIGRPAGVLWIKVEDEYSFGPAEKTRDSEVNKLKHEETLLITTNITTT
uniref:uncharacterized protein n=1 Tax=Myxine glutinosa TaxID=7769 RepID=UPI00358FEC8C